MFDDLRSKKVIFLAHCLLNQNAVSADTAVFPGMVEEILRVLQKAGVGVVQMPCPELMCLGLERGNRDGQLADVLVENSRIRRAMKEQLAVNRAIRLIDQVIYQIKEYRKVGFEILGIVGINRSPSCGVQTTTRYEQEVPGRGLFIIGLENKLESNKIDGINITGIKPAEKTKAVAEIKRLIKK